MQKQVKTESGEITVTALKRRQIKELKAQGYNLGNIPQEQAEEVSEAVLKMGLSEEDYNRLDDLYQYEVGLLFQEIMRLTFLGDEPAKNSG